MNRTRSRPSISPQDRSSFAERRPVTELDAVGIDVLPEQRHLENAVGDQHLDLGQHVTRAPVGLLAAQRRHDAEGAGVVAAHRDRDPARSSASRALAGNEDGKTSSDSRISSWASSLCLARSSSVGSDPTLCVPNTTSTHGARRRISPRSFCARQPPTAICMPGRFAFTDARWPRLPYSLLSAFSRTAQVLKTTTSAGLAGDRHSVPGLLEQPGQPLGVVHVHLAAVGPHLVGARLVAEIGGL